MEIFYVSGFIFHGAVSFGFCGKGTTYKVLMCSHYVTYDLCNLFIV